MANISLPFWNASKLFVDNCLEILLNERVWLEMKDSKFRISLLPFSCALVRYAFLSSVFLFHTSSACSFLIFVIRKVFSWYIIDSETSLLKRHGFWIMRAGLLNLLQRIRRILLILALAPLYWLEEEEKERKLRERLKKRQ